jgi:AcrR family transcriptional regulator
MQERRQLERQARRRKIQRAARRIFAERGFAGATIEEIARKASLSVGAIYLYFRSKEDLYVSLLEESLEGLVVEMEAALERSRDPRMQLRAVWELFVSWRATFRELLRVLSLPTLAAANEETVSGEVLGTLGRSAGRCLAIVSAIVDRGIGAQVFRADCRESASDLLWGALSGLLSLEQARTSLALPAADFTAASRGAFELLERGMLA